MARSAIKPFNRSAPPPPSPPRRQIPPYGGVAPIPQDRLPQYYQPGGPQQIESQPQPPTQSDYYVSTGPDGKRQLYARPGSALTQGIGQEVYDAAIAQYDARSKQGLPMGQRPSTGSGRGGTLGEQLPPEQQGQEFGLPPGGPDTLRGKFAAFMGSPIGKAAQAAPMALTGGIVGFGLGGPVGGLVGAAIGGIGGVALPQYQQQEVARLAASLGFAEAQKKFDEENVVGMALHWLDIPRQSLEQAVGTVAQLGGAALAPERYGTFGEVVKNLGATWKAARLTYESAPVGFSGIRQDEHVWVDYDLPETNGGLLPLVEARRRIAAGEDSATVYNEIATRFGAPGQLRELASGLVADPLNFTNVIETRAVGLAGWALKDAELIEAAARTASHPGLFSTREAYKNLLLTKPLREGLEVGRELTTLQRFVIGKELLNLADKGTYTPPKWYELGRLTPESAARETVFKAHDMLGTLVAQIPNDDAMPAAIESLIGSFKHADLEALPKDFPEAARLGLSVEGRVVRRSINEAAVLDKTQAYAATMAERQLLSDLAAALGDTHEGILKRIADGEGAALLKELRTRAEAQGPEGVGLLASIDNGTLDAKVLTEMSKTFGEDGVPYTPEMLKASVMESLIEASGGWAAKTFGVKSADWLTRFATAVKGVESVALLGLNISYPIRNFWNGEATVIVDGIWGLRGIASIEQEWERLGVLPARAMAGMGIADLGSDITSTAIGARAVRAGLAPIEKATATEGILTEIREFTKQIGDKLPPTHIAQQMERWQGARAFYEGFRQMWSQLRQRDATIPRLPQSVEAGLRAADPRLPDYLYAAARAGYNPAEITAAVLAEAPAPILHSFYAKAGAAVGISDGDVARLMALDGVGDALNDQLAQLGPKAKTSDVARIFDRTRRAAEKSIAAQIQAEAATATERAAAVPGVEGALGVLGITDDIETDLLSTFTHHAQNLDKRWAEVFREGKPKAATIKAMFAEADQVWTNYQTREAAAYAGLDEGMGRAGLNLSSEFMPAIKGKQQAIRAFTQLKNDLLRAFFGADHEPGTRTAAWEATTKAIDDAYFGLSVDLEKQQTAIDSYIVAVYKERVGPGLADGVQAWRDAVKKFNAEDMQRVREFRRQVRTLPDFRQAKAWTEFHNERLQRRWQATQELINFRRNLGGEPPAVVPPPPPVGAAPIPEIGKRPPPPGEVPPPPITHPPGEPPPPAPAPVPPPAPRPVTPRKPYTKPTVTPITRGTVLTEAPRDFLPEGISEAMRLQARQMMTDVQEGTAGRRIMPRDEQGYLTGEVMAEPSTYPEWYGATGRRRQAIINALERIQKDSGLDVDKGGQDIISTLKHQILIEMQKTNPLTGQPPEPEVLRWLGHSEEDIAAARAAWEAAGVSPRIAPIEGDVQTTITEPPAFEPPTAQQPPPPATAEFNVNLDQTKQAAAIGEITDTELFKALKANAANLRARHAARAPKPPTVEEVTAHLETEIAAVEMAASRYSKPTLERVTPEGPVLPPEIAAVLRLQDKGFAVDLNQAFGVPPAPEPPGTQTTMFTQGQDLPLFSGTAQATPEAAFIPQEVAQQPTLPGVPVAPEMAGAIPAAAPELVEGPTIAAAIAKSQSGKDARNVAKLLHNLGIESRVVQDESFYAHVKNAPYLDLVIERHDDRLHFIHYIEEGGDLIIDSEMIYRMDAGGGLHLAETAGRGMRGEWRSAKPDQPFARMFSKNLLDQGFDKGTLERKLTTPAMSEVMGAPRIRTMMDELVPRMFEKGNITDRKSLEKLAKFVWPDFDVKNEQHLHELYDSMEGAGNLYLRKRLAGVTDLAERIGIADEVEAKLITARRTITKSKLQQFSTPYTLGEAAQFAADIRPSELVLEPTAGTGSLINRVDGAQVWANEIDETRIGVLNAMEFGQVTSRNVMGKEWVFDADGNLRPPSADVVVQNPPWGAYSKGDYGKPIDITYTNAAGKEVTFTPNDWSQRFFHLIDRQAKPGARIVAVMPENTLHVVARKTGFDTPAGVNFRKWLDDQFYVRAMIQSPPGAYDARATGVGSILLVVDKMQKPVDAVKPIMAWGDTAPQTWEEYNALVSQLGAGGSHARTQEAVNATIERPAFGPDATGLADPTARTGAAADPANIGKPAEPAAPKPKRGRKRVPVVSELPAERPAENLGVGAAPAGGTNQPPTVEPVAGLVEPGRGANALEPTGPAGAPPAPVVEGQPGAVQPGVQRAHTAGFVATVNAGKEAARHSPNFALYVARSPVVHSHPTAVVETKTLAGIPYPPLEPEFQPSPVVMRALDRFAISNEGNLDPVWATIQQNDKFNSGVLIADDVGMGKSRTAGAFALDRIEKGKSRILVMTDSAQNVDTLMNVEFPGVYSGVAEESGAWREIPGDFPAQRVHVNGANFPEVKKGEQPLPTFDGPAVYFVDANNFAHFAEALRDLHFDSVIVDEVDKFKNLDTARGAAWGLLHKDWLSRQTDFMYLSATPAIDVSDLEYLYGLKVWRQDGFSDWLDIITGRASEQAVTQRQIAREAVDGFLKKIDAEVERIGAPIVEHNIKGTGIVDARDVGPYAVYPSIERVNAYAIEHKASGVVVWNSPTEKEGILFADRLARSDIPPNATYDEMRTVEAWNHQRDVVDATRRAVKDEFPLDLSKQQLGDVGIKDASDVLSKSASGKSWGGKSGPGAFSYTLPPAHTEQVMRELKVGGSYMSRDISRAGVEFGVKEYAPPPEAIAKMNDRVKLYRDLFGAFNKFGKMNEGPKKAAALFGITGDIQADAKRTLFDMRLPGVLEESDAALARGEKVVISVVSVSETGEDSGSIPSAISKINVQQVKKVGKGEYSDPTEIPEALIAVAELRDRLHELPTLRSPMDVIREHYGDRVMVISGDVSVQERAKARAAFQQQNDIDVIVISGAGKRGINLHDVTGDRRVHLIVGDYEWSASSFKQELGRVDRTGQKTSPIVTLMHTGSAGERKFVATISNRMKGLGAASKGGAEATGTSAMTDVFELGSTTDRLALQKTWENLDPADKGLFLDKYFRDPQVPDVPRATLPGDAQAIKKFLLGLQSMEVDRGNAIFDQFWKWRGTMQGTESWAADEATRTAKGVGQVTRRTQLAPNLWMNEVKNEAGEKFGVLEGVLSPQMNRVKGALESGGNLETDEGMAGVDAGNAWMKWIQFQNIETGDYVSGLKIKPSAVKRVAQDFGQMIAQTHAPETIVADLKAGDRVKIYGAGGKVWELYQGKGGNRAGAIIVDGAKMADRDALMRNGATYQSAGNFFEVPEAKVPDFLARFPIRNEAAGVEAAATSTGSVGGGGVGPSVGDVIPTRAGDFSVESIDPATNEVTLKHDASGALYRLPYHENMAAHLPPGMLDHLTGGGPMPHAQAREEAWYDKLLPLLGELQKNVEQHVAQGSVKGHAGLAPELQAGVRDWLGQVNSQMADAKLQAIKWGQFKRDASLLNYSRRYQFNNFLGLGFPYEFWMTHSMMNWAMRAIDKPALLANYYRLQKFINTEVTKPGFPSRLAGRVKIPLPFLPAWMGNGMFVDPMTIGLPLQQFFAPWEQLQQQTTQLNTRATRKLEDMVANGQISQADYSQALTTQSGPAWSRALALAKADNAESTFDGVDFASLIVSPHLPLQWAYNMARGTPEQIQPLPGTRQLKALTAAMGIGPAGGVNIEAGLRRHFGLPLFDQWEDYRIDRELANMAGEGLTTPEQAQAAMIERQGPLFEQAQQRAGRVGGFGTITNMIFGTSAGIFPEGEQRQRLLGELIKAAHQAQDNGDPDALAKFFEAHPEYEARLALYQKPDERIKNFLVDQVWNGYNNLPELYKREVRAQFGSSFADAFMNPETRSYDSIPPDTLAAWARTLGRYVPANVDGAPIDLQLSPPEVAMEAQQYYALRKQFFGDPVITALQSAYFLIPQHARATDKPMPPAVDDYYNLRDQLFPNNAGLWDLYHNLPKNMFQQEADVAFPNIGAKWDAYHALPASSKERRAYWKANPDLGQYMDWAEAWKADHPESKLRAQFFEQFPQLKQQLTWQEAFYSKHPEVKAYLDTTDVSARDAFITAHPELKQYWEFRRGWLDEHPVSAPFITEKSPAGQAQGAAPTAAPTDQQQPQAEGAQILASPEMQTLVMAHLFAGVQLEGAAYRILRDEFVRQGGQEGTDKRGRGNLDAWLINVVAFGGNLGQESYSYNGGAPGAFWPSAQSLRPAPAPRVNLGAQTVTPAYPGPQGNAAPNPYATTPQGGTGGAMQWADMAAQQGAQFGVPPEFILSLIKAESNGNPNAVGDGGHSVGLFQLHDHGVGTGYTVEQRQDPALQFQLMMPRIAAAYQSGVAQGLSGRALAMHVGQQAERPAAAAVPRYGVAYDQIVGGR